MKGNKHVLVMTIASILSLCFLIMIVFNSGLKDSDFLESYLTFKGMWIAIGIVIVSYLIPLSLYVYRFDWLKYVILIFNYFSIFISLFLIGFVMTTGVLNESLSAYMGLISSCIMNIIINIIWIITMYVTKRHHPKKEISHGV